MKDYDSLLEETLEAWEDVRTGLIEELRKVPPKRLEYRPTEEVRSVRELVVHILEVALMMTGELTREDTDFRRKPWPELLELYASGARAAETKSDLVRLLRAQYRDAEKKFLEAGELHMLQLIERFDGRKGTRLAWLHHGIAQEMYHRGQLTLYLRLLGIEPALTERIRGV